MEKLERFLHLLLVAAAVGTLLTLVITACAGESDEPQGETGERGEPGTPGEAGDSGEGCTVERVELGAVVTCGNASVFVRDGDTGAKGDTGVGVAGEAGVPGRDGVDGAAATGVTLVTPCPDTAASVLYPERLLRFADGAVVAFYSSPDWMYNRLVTLIVGATYVTTDGRACQFVAE